MAGRLKFFYMWRKIQAEYFSSFAEAEQDGLLRKMNKLFNISSSGFALGNNFVFIYIHKENIPDVTTNNESISMMFIAESSDCSLRVYFLDREAAKVVEVSVQVSLENGYFSII